MSVLRVAFADSYAVTDANTDDYSRADGASHGVSYGGRADDGSADDATADGSAPDPCHGQRLVHVQWLVGHPDRRRVLSCGGPRHG